MAKILSKELVEALLVLDDCPVERVKTPEWKEVCDEVLVRTMTGSERDEYEIAISKLDVKQRERNIRARLLSMVIIDEQGERLFGEANIERLGKKSIKAINRVFAAAQRLNALTEADIEDLAKN